MSLAWVAGSVRAGLLAGRRVGRSGARTLAGRGSLADALRELAGSPYGRELEGARSLEEAQRAVAATLLWNLRVLAGWLPPGGGERLRALAAWFEIANVQDRLAYLAPPHEIRTPPPHPAESAPRHRDSAGTPGPRFRGDPGTGRSPVLRPSASLW